MATLRGWEGWRIGRVRVDLVDGDAVRAGHRGRAANGRRAARGFALRARAPARPARAAQGRDRQSRTPHAASCGSGPAGLAMPSRERSSARMNPPEADGSMRTAPRRARWLPGGGVPLTRRDDRVRRHTLRRSPSPASGWRLSSCSSSSRCTTACAPDRTGGSHHGRSTRGVAQVNTTRFSSRRRPSYRHRWSILSGRSPAWRR